MTGDPTGGDPARRPAGIRSLQALESLVESDLLPCIELALVDSTFMRFLCRAHIWGMTNGRFPMRRFPKSGIGALEAAIPHNRPGMRCRRLASAALLGSRTVSASSGAPHGCMKIAGRSRLLQDSLGQAVGPDGGGALSPTVGYSTVSRSNRLLGATNLKNPVPGTRLVQGPRSGNVHVGPTADRSRVGLSPQWKTTRSYANAALISAIFYILVG